MALAMVMPGSHTAKSTSVVVPPQSAARLTCSGGALVVWPPSRAGMGQWVCTWGSMPPGITSLPVASMMRPASQASVPGAAMEMMRSPSIPTSHTSTPWGVTTCPPRITRSSMTLSPSLVAEQERRDALGLAQQRSEARHRHVDDLGKLLRSAEALERLGADELEEDVGRAWRHRDEVHGEHPVILEEDHAEGSGRLVRHDRRLLHAPTFHRHLQEVVSEELGRRGRLVEVGAEDRP